MSAAAAPPGVRQQLLRLTTRRLLGGLLVLLAVSAIVFVATDLASGDAVASRFSPETPASVLAAERERLGLDRPAPERYARWLGGVLTGDLGTSYASGEPVGALVRERAVNSALLGGLAALLLVPIATGLGVWSGLRTGGPADRVLSAGTLGLLAIPDFVTGTLLILLFAIQLGWLPAVSFLPAGEAVTDRPAVLVLPVLTLLAVSVAQNTRMVRAGVAAATRGDAAEAARLNGVPESRVILRYVLPAALPPAVPLFARYVSLLIGGTLIVETLFGYPGLASSLVQASGSRDVPVVQAVALLAAAITVLANLLGDVVGVLLDPLRRLPA